MAEVGRDIWRPYAPTSLLKHLEQVVHDHLQAVFGDLQGRDSTASLGKGWSVLTPAEEEMDKGQISQGGQEHTRAG